MGTEHFLTEAEIKVIDSATKTLQTINQSFKELGIGVEKQKQGLQKYSEGIKAIAQGMGIAGAAILAEAGLSVRAAGEQARADAQLNAVLESTHHAAGLTADQVKKMATALQEVTDYSDETIQSGQNMLLTFTNLHADVFPRATKAMLDMSTAMGTDLKGTAIQLGKALNDPIQGIAALSRVGVQFTQVQKDQIKTMVEAGRGMEAQKMILQELEKEFGGSAEAVSTPMQQLKNQINEVQEALGTALLPTVKELTAAVIPHVKAMAAWITAHQELVTSVGKVVVVLGAIMAAIGAASLVIGKMVAAFGALRAGIMAVVEAGPAIIGFFVAIGGPLTLLIAGLAAVAVAAVAMKNKVSNAWAEVDKNTAASVQAQQDEWGKWNNAASQLAANEQEYAKLRAKAQYYILQATLLTESQIAAIRSGASQEQLDAIQANIDGNNKWAREAADAAINYANTNTISMDKVKSAYAGVGVSAKAAAFNQGTAAADSKNKIAEVKKAVEDLDKSYWSAVRDINQRLLELKANHKTTMDDLRKQLGDTNNDIQRLGSEYKKAMADILEAHNKTMDGLSDDKGNAVIETYKKLVELQQKLKDNSGKEGALSTDQIVTITANRQDKGDTLSQRDKQSFNVSDTGEQQINDLLKLRKEQEGLTKVLAENYNLTKEQKAAMDGTYGEAQLAAIKKIIDANKELTKANDYGNLTDLQKQFVGFSKKATEETKEFTRQQTEKNQNYTEELDKLKTTRAELQRKMNMETTVYENTRNELLNTKKSMQEFHDTYTMNLQDIDKVTKETVESLKQRLEDLKNTIAGIDALMKAKANITGGQTITDKAKNTNVAKSANGNVFTSPAITEIAEGQYAEAVVPLPDGRSIPVVMQGQPQTSSNTINIDMGGVVIKNDMDLNKVTRTIVTAVDNQLLKAR